MDEASNRQQKRATANKNAGCQWQPVLKPHPTSSHEFLPSFLILKSLLTLCWLFFLQSFKVHSRTKCACVAGVRRQKSKYVINPGHFIISQMVIIKMTMTITFINELGAILLSISPTCCSSPVMIGVRMNREEKGRKMRPKLAEKVPWTTLHLCTKHLSVSSLFLLQPYDSLNNKTHSKLGV